MSSRAFHPLLKNRQDQGLLSCVGLDPNYGWILEVVRPRGSMTWEEVVYPYLCRIIDATHDLVGCFKANEAFFKSSEGWRTFRRVVSYVQNIAPGVPIIADAKVGDVPSTMEEHARAIFGSRETHPTLPVLEPRGLNADAVTVQSYFGGESLQPFLKHASKGVVVVCLSSNEGAKDFQLQPQAVSAEKWHELTSGPAGTSGKADHPPGWNGTFGQIPLYQTVALRTANHWNTNGNCLLVVGATYPEEARQLRQLIGDLPFLIPGVGAQGANLLSIVEAAQDSNGRGMIISASRSVLYASTGQAYATAAREAVLRLNDEIQRYL